MPLHGLRHTSASIALAAGVPLEILSKRLGHKSVGTTADIYAHLLTEADKAAADALDNFLAGRVKPAAERATKRAKST